MRFLLHAYAFVGFIVTLCSLFAMAVSVYERISIKLPTVALFASVTTSIVAVALAEYMFT